MRFCRSCYAVMGDTQPSCSVCGANWTENKTVTSPPPVASSKDVEIQEKKMEPLSPHTVKQSTALEQVKRVEEPISKPADKPYRAIWSPSKKTEDQPPSTEPLKSTDVQKFVGVMKRVDVLVLVIFGAILLVKTYLSVGRLFEPWDGYVYLLNARTFASGNLGLPNYFEVLRPPLYPYVISGLWGISGEDIAFARTLSPMFAVAAATLLFFLLKDMFNLETGLVASVGFLLSPVITDNTDAVLVHGLGVFLVTLVVFALWKTRLQPSYYLIAGFACALASLTRYPDILIGIGALVFLLIDLKSKPKGRKSILNWGAMGILTFVLVWLPWLFWCQSIYGDPFISLKLAVISGTSGTGGAGPDLLFYLKAIRDLVAVPPISPSGRQYLLFGLDAFTVGREIGTIIAGSLLLIGLISRDWVKDRRRILIALWFLAFSGYYSGVGNQTVRFMVEWAPPIFAFIAIGASASYVFMKQRMHLDRLIPRISVSTIVGIWLITLMLGSVAVQFSSHSLLYPVAYEGPNYGLGSVSGFEQSISWLHQNMKITDIGATDLAPFFSYYTDRLFYDAGYMQQLATAGHISLREELLTQHVKYVVLTDYYILQSNLDLTSLFKVQEFTGYTIYATS